MLVDTYFIFVVWEANYTYFIDEEKAQSSEETFLFGPIRALKKYRMHIIESLDKRVSL